MRRHRRTAWLLGGIALSAGCSESGLVYRQAAEPACAITSPDAGASTVPGDTTACLVVSDADTPPTSLAVTWRVEPSGAEVSGPSPDESGLSCATVPLEDGDARLEGMVTDPEGLSGLCTQDLTIDSAAPVPPEVALSPDPTTTQDDLTATLVTSPTDAEGESLAVSWSWSVDGALQSDLTDAVLPASATTRGEVWMVTALAESGEGMASAEIVNSPPGAPTLALSPDPPTETLDGLRCDIVAPSEDADGDLVTYQVAWQLDGVDWAGSVETDSEAGDTLPVSALDEEQVWRCVVTPEDGIEAGTSAAVETTVLERRFVGISAGAWHACAWDDLGRVSCWGDDSDGQVSSTPDDVFVVVDASTRHSCGLTDGDELRCWGLDDGGDMDKGQVSDVPTSGAWAVIGAAGSNNCAIDTAGSLSCWGNTDDGRSDPPSGSDYVEVVGGVSWLCATDSTGAVTCWGEHAHGVGDEPTESLYGLSAGNHACGLTQSSDAAVCWGYDDYGQTAPPSDAFVAVSAGQKHSCGLLTDASISCWGSDISGESSSPEGSFVEVSAASHIDSSADYFTCALDSENELHCFGADTHGQLSDMPGAP